MSLVTLVGWELLVAALSEGLGVSAQHAEVLAVLIQRRGEELRFEELRAALGLHRPVKQGALYERVSYLRKVLGRDVIGGYRPPNERFHAPPHDDGRRLKGWRIADSTYSLSDEGFRRCRDALQRMADRLPLRPEPGKPLAENSPRHGKVAPS